MIKFDHVAKTVKNLDEAIKFYELLGYKVVNVFDDEDYVWANMDLKGIFLELFQIKKSNLESIEHIAYSYEEKEELLEILNKLGKNLPNSFYGDLNRETIFIEDIEGNEIQFIKRQWQGAKYLILYMWY